MPKNKETPGRRRRWMAEEASRALVRSSKRPRIASVPRSGHVLGLLTLLAGCSDEQGVRVQGSPSNVKTAPGEYDGYEVFAECQLPSVAYGVRGTGSRWYHDAAPGAPERINALWELGDAFEPTLRSVQSLDGIGVGTSCTLDAGVSVQMSDWREVDVVLERAGQFLSEGELREEVGVRVTVSYSQ